MILTLLILLGIAIILNFIISLIAYSVQSDKFTDITYSLTFIILILIAFFYRDINIYKIILMTIIIIWAVRLGVFLLIRINYFKKDKRFDDIRNKFSKFLGFFLFQGVTAWVVLIPSILFLLIDNPQINYIFYMGYIIWIKGFLFETISDYQKFRFIKDSKNKRKFIKNGLWKYSRHPNYYGEILCWIGIFVMTGYTLYKYSLSYFLIGLISPIFIYIILRYVSGIPILERNSDKKYKDNKDYPEYKKKTPLLIPYKLI